MKTAAHGPVIPGLLVTVHGRGVLLEGPSGAGKSDTALALLDRGHALVADDAVQLRREGDRLLGTGPQQGRGLLHLRDLGLVDVTELYGPEAFRNEAAVALCIQLQPTPGTTEAEAALHGRRDHRRLLELSLPRITLTDSHRRPLAPLVEAASSSRAAVSVAHHGARSDRGVPA
ncbi:HPr kinase/phosphorylase [Halorhodospira halophila]|uniref:Hpr(Ser) kinase/phosphatase n=1 Tax=Halorhodospira halophila (strain DSM 244 / SL1) TaxID=349124 RepID=A1WYY1_HALHL|nr:HPr kinase [Halorhodospira halophila]ABM62893.1 Hpr(Ser) kinase/phosphatase [Halorhodospira halophila SL1]